MDTPPCPACAAAVRPGATWCSLCYLDLRITPVTVVAAPLVEASLEPGPVRWSESGSRVGARSVGLQGIIDADVIEVPPDPPPTPSWPCTCGAQVLMERDACTGCGSTFLAELSEVRQMDGGGARHRRGTSSRMSRWGSRWLTTRARRLSFAGLVALLLAVALPTLLALVG